MISPLVLGSHNVNGIRAAMRRGFRPFWDSEGADVIALQEVRCRLADLPTEAFTGYHTALETGTLPGRNGVAVMTRLAPTSIRTLSGGALLAGPDGAFSEVEAIHLPNRDLAHFSHEGRYIEVDLSDAPVRVASLYLPKGAAWPHEEDGKDKYDRKMRFLKGLSRLLTSSRREAAAEGRQFVVVGDFNIAHTELDLKNWRTNKRSEGFLPEERQWFSSVVGPRRLLDVVRHVHPGVDGPYTWWSWRGQAFTNDAGWRIDYHLASPALARSATTARVAREADYDSRISDHSPVVVHYDMAALAS
ncbi:exodeoxyribonuclease III [Tessaracoccus antarcticus]|uniref:Exodeoxyribonuclease III n=1 Tax=Tessaracoccus antarcticus TaxID=2479848 RepID=A0A3M0FZY2_9ACTN|nr:exodeoxyribonuclease III [Tessaracoccus antarcticus]RMB58250.1 exodeoxyribonuclease III [Tessaracoccus antarcticus]